MKSILAFALFLLAGIAVLAGMAMVCIAASMLVPTPAQAAVATPKEPIVACVKVELPGKEHTLNPFAPPKLQRQEVVSVCQQLRLPDMVPIGPAMVIAPGRTIA